MTTSTWNNISEDISSSKPVKIMIPIGVFCALILGTILYFMNLQTVTTYTYTIDNTLITPSEIKIFEINGFHALDKHGISVFDGGLKCLDKYGSIKTFRTFGFRNKNTEPRTTFLCLDLENKEWYGIVTTGFKNNATTIITVYNVIQKLHPTIFKYIEYLQKDWGAIEINYTLSAGKFLLKSAIEGK